MRLGNNDIDFSPAFTMFLTTRDPSVEFAADLNSRVTMVNFSVSVFCPMSRLHTDGYVPRSLVRVCKHSRSTKSFESSDPTPIARDPTSFVSKASSEPSFTLSRSGSSLRSTSHRATSSTTTSESSFPLRRAGADYCLLAGSSRRSRRSNERLRTSRGRSRRRTSSWRRSSKSQTSTSRSPRRAVRSSSSSTSSTSSTTSTNSPYASSLTSSTSSSSATPRSRT